MISPRAFLCTAAVLGLVACGDDDEGQDGYDCGAYCEDVASCPGRTVTDCAQLCDQVASLEQKSGCADAWEAWVACNGENRDEVCAETPRACLAQGVALYSCVQTYCSANGDDADCQALLAFL